MAGRKPSSERWTGGGEDWQDELSDDALREMAGDDVFERGQAYFLTGKVSMARDGGGDATFKVKGTQTYSTELYFEDMGLHMDCTCPHAKGGGFCKHMVAAGLFWRCRLDGNEPPGLENKAQIASKLIANQKRQATVASKREALKGFVFAQDARQLAEQLWNWANEDRDLMAALKSWHAQSAALDGPEGWKAGIAAILEKSRNFYDWGESSAYARRAAAVFPLLEKIVKASPEQGRAACAFALRKLYKVGEHADDSSGMIGDLMHGVQALLLKALKAEPPPGQWLDEWFALMEADPWGLWNESEVLDAAGQAVQRQYSERVGKDWHAYVKSLSATPKPADAKSKPVARAASIARGGGAWDPVRAKLRKRFIDDLKRQGDGAAVQEALAASADGAGEHSELVAWCESLGKTREALDYALRARKLFPNDWRSEEDLLRCDERDGWDNEALAIRRSRFEKNPGVQQFDALLKAAGAAGLDVSAYRESLDHWAAERERQSQEPQPPWFRPVPANQGRLVTTRVRWLMHEKKWDQALALVQPPHACDGELLYQLAQKVRKNHPQKALALLQRVFASSMPKASTPYAEELQLVKEVAQLMAQPDRGQWLARLRAEYKIKRNFIKGLDALKP